MKTLLHPILMFLSRTVVYALVPAALVWGARPLCAQESPAQAPQNPAVWRARVPGGTYVVLLSSLRSISTHQYLVNGVGLITELTIDAGGSTTARFYSVEPPKVESPSGVGQAVISRAQEVVGEARNRLDPGRNLAVVIKDYPNTTHSHTVEYLLPSSSDVVSLFENLERAWARGRGGQIEVGFSANQ